VFPPSPTDIDDDKNFSGNELRSYRGSLSVVERAANAWQLQPHSFVLQLGDIIDGQNSGKYGQGLSKFSPTGSQSDVALQKVLSAFLKYGWSSDKIYSAVGNHEFYCWPDRAAIASKIPQISAAGAAAGNFFQSFSPAAGWRVVILDAYDVAIIGRSINSSEYKQAMGLLRSNNPNILEDGRSTSNFLTNLCARPLALCPHPLLTAFAASGCRADSCPTMAPSAVFS
jgi:manganese-dependent ADP-ribose/CDP-alcohol diphosphatase